MSPKKGFADYVAICGPTLRRLLTKLEFDDSESLGESDRIKEENMQRRRWLILENLASISSVANVFVASSVWLELLGIIAGFFKFTKLHLSRQGAAKVLTRLIWDPSTGTVIGKKLGLSLNKDYIKLVLTNFAALILGPLLQKFLPLPLLTIIKDMGAEVMLQAFDNDCENPELIWNASLREELKNAVTAELEPVFSSCTPNDLDKFAIDSMFELKYKQLEDELNIGGVYVRLFLMDTSCQLRDPSGFLEMLLFHWARLIEFLIEGQSELMMSSIASNSQDSLQDITKACVSLCSHSYLCVKLAPLGIMKKSVIYLHKFNEKGLCHYQLLSVFRLLQAAITQRVNVESLLNSSDPDGKNGIVDGLMKSIGTGKLHPKCSLMLRTMKDITNDLLGEVEKKERTFYLQTTITAQMNPSIHPKALALAPSPAPGTDPVKKMEKLAGDDPLSMLLGNHNQSSSVNNAAKLAPNNGTKSVKQTFTNNPLSPNTTQKHVSSDVVYQPTSTNHSTRSQNIATVYKPKTTATPLQSTPSVAPSGTNLSVSTVYKPKAASTPVQSNSSSIYNPLVSSVQSNHPTVYKPKPTVTPGSYQSSTIVQTLYKHPVPQGRGIKPLRNQGTMQNKNVAHPPLPFKTDANIMNINSPSNVNVQRPNHVALPGNQSISLGGNPSHPETISKTTLSTKNVTAERNQSHYTKMNPATDSNPLNSHSAPNQVQASQSAGNSTFQQISSASKNHPMYTPNHYVNTDVTTKYPASYSQRSALHVNYITNQQNHASQIAPQLSSSNAPQHYHSSQMGSQFNYNNNNNNNVTQQLNNTSNATQQYYGSQQLMNPQLKNNNSVSQQYNGSPTVNQMNHPINFPQPHYGAHMGPTLNVNNNLVSHLSYSSQSGQQVSSYQHMQLQADIPTVSNHVPFEQNTQQPYNSMVSSNDNLMSQRMHNNQHYLEERVTPPVDPKVLATERMNSSDGAPGSAKGRKKFLSSVLSCGLLQFLIDDVLENPTLDDDVDEPESVKEYAVEILNLLLMDPGYGLMFYLVLNSLANFEKYKDKVLGV